MQSSLLLSVLLHAALPGMIVFLFVVALTVEEVLCVEGGSSDHCRFHRNKLKNFYFEKKGKTNASTILCIFKNDINHPEQKNKCMSKYIIKNQT